MVQTPVGGGQARSHAALPALAPTPNRRAWDLYVSARDDHNRAQIFRADLGFGVDGDLSIGEFDPDPVLAAGELGGFDDSGVTLSCLVDHDGRRLLYYSGWSLGVTVPFYFYAGAAVSHDGGRTFERLSRAPILDRDDIDPYLTGSPAVLLEDGTWRMWYISATDWRLLGGEPQHRYHIRYAESRDGVRWRRDGHVCIDYRGDEEYAIGRPCVIKDGARYRMWFCARGQAYRLGYAESDDGLHWERDDSAVSLIGEPGEWEADMQAYPHVFRDGGALHMLYNGNAYGRTGVGWATLEQAR